jgi:hypothetical protein
MRPPLAFGSIVLDRARELDPKGRLMKYLRRTALLSLALLVLFVPDKPNAQQVKTFQLAFCNLSQASPIYIALTHRRDASRWAVEGWFPLLGSGCSILGTFQQGEVYFYAFGVRNNQYVFWSPADGDEAASTQCVDRDKAFSGLLAANPSCPDGQVPVRFRKLQIGDTPLFTFTLRD